jgi:hypothetical protein
MTPNTKALSSASAPQISFAQLIANGPYGTAARAIKYADQCSQTGMNQVKSSREERRPKKVQKDMINARERRRSEAIERETVARSWRSDWKVGRMF